MLGLGRQTVECVRLSEPRLNSGLLNETVACQTEKMSANRVIGELERGRELIHGLFARPQLLKNSPSRTLQQSLSPSSVLHSEKVRSVANQVKAVEAESGLVVTNHILLRVDCLPVAVTPQKHVGENCSLHFATLFISR